VHVRARAAQAGPQQRVAGRARAPLGVRVEARRARTRQRDGLGPVVSQQPHPVEVRRGQPHAAVVVARLPAHRDVLGAREKRREQVALLVAALELDRERGQLGAPRLAHAVGKQRVLADDARQRMTVGADDEQVLEREAARVRHVEHAHAAPAPARRPDADAGPARTQPRERLVALEDDVARRLGAQRGEPRGPAARGIVGLEARGRGQGPRPQPPGHERLEVVEVPREGGARGPAGARLEQGRDPIARALEALAGECTGGDPGADGLVAVLVVPDGTQAEPHRQAQPLAPLEDHVDVEPRDVPEPARAGRREADAQVVVERRALRGPERRERRVRALLEQRDERAGAPRAVEQIGGRPGPRPRDAVGREVPPRGHEDLVERARDDADGLGPRARLEQRVDAPGDLGQLGVGARRGERARPRGRAVRARAPPHARGPARAQPGEEATREARAGVLGARRGRIVGVLDEDRAAECREQRPEQARRRARRVREADDEQRARRQQPGAVLGQHARGVRERVLVARGTDLGQGRRDARGDGGDRRGPLGDRRGPGRARQRRPVALGQAGVEQIAHAGREQPGPSVDLLDEGAQRRVAGGLAAHDELEQRAAARRRAARALEDLLRDDAHGLDADAEDGRGDVAHDRQREVLAQGPRRHDDADRPREARRLAPGRRVQAAQATHELGLAPPRVARDDDRSSRGHGRPCYRPPPGRRTARPRPGRRIRSGAHPAPRPGRGSPGTLSPERRLRRPGAGTARARTSPAPARCRFGGATDVGFRVRSSSRIRSIPGFRPRTPAPPRPPP